MMTTEEAIIEAKCRWGPKAYAKIVVDDFDGTSYHVYSVYGRFVWNKRVMEGLTPWGDDNPSWEKAFKDADLRALRRRMEQEQFDLENKELAKYHAEHSCLGRKNRNE